MNGFVINKYFGMINVFVYNIMWQQFDNRNLESKYLCMFQITKITCVNHQYKIV